MIHANHKMSFVQDMERLGDWYNEMIKFKDPVDF